LQDWLVGLFLEQLKKYDMANIVLIHRILVTLFLLQYVVKLILLLVGKTEELAKYTKMTRVIEIIVSVGFLVTGIWLLYNTTPISTLLIIKLVCVLAAIPTAIIGFKRGNKALAALAVVLILAAYGLAEANKKHQGDVKVDTSSTSDPLEKGKIVYQNATCINCHGADGKLGVNGAKDLSVTTLSIDEQKAIIKSGKGMMPPFDKLTDDQLKDVTFYIGTLRK
jgi:mono/diheme cytochrome c family protein